ncbi:MAG: alpha/beta fold hydrolase [Desulfocapsa sp.]|uniref:Alpha/beta fold hydrolase n=1 Tax=Desulfotalea psychrophila TaxID=84980 RepID=A0ABS3AS53_9BACT|nr:alpha/beta fold hydrolase [Desulfocapsa sp.]MBN4067955.1 alpha/beta fold hydrolase [Desulfotalea psychrophila]
MYPDYPFQSNYYTIGNHRLHYVDEGQGDVILMVHGNPTWSFYFRKLITLLAKNHRIIAVDHLGCGLSDKPQEYNYSLQNHINNLDALLQHLRVKSFSLVVHDWGGAIGMGVAVKNIDSIQRAMVLNTAAFRSDRIPFRISVCRWPVVGKLLVRGLNGFAGPAVKMAVSKKMAKNVAAAFLAPYDSWNNRVAVSSFVEDIPLDSSHPSYQTLLKVEKGLEQLQTRQLPMLICWGGKDFCFNDSFYDEWCKRFPHADAHYFKDGGHYILEDAFDEIAPLALSFFEDTE